LSIRQLARGASIVAAGTVLGQGAILIVTPWLARIYTPADFGALALIATVTNVATRGACLRYDMALPSAPEEHGRPLFIVAIVAAMVVASTAFFVCEIINFIHGAPLRPPFDEPWIIGTCVLLVGVYQAGMAWATRLRAFSSVAGLRIAQGLCFSGLAASHFVSLVFAQVVSFATALPTVFKGLRGGKGRDIGAFRVARLHRQFPLLSLPGAMLDAVGYSLCIWIISAVYGAPDAGQFSQIQRLIGGPLMLTAQSLGQVLLKHSADATYSSEAMRRLFSRLRFSLIGLAGCVVTCTAAFGTPILHLLLGAQWRVNFEFIVPLAVAVSARACASPLSTFLITLRRFDISLYWQIAYFLSALIVLRLLASHLSFESFAIAYGCHELVFYAGYLWLIGTAVRTTPCAAYSG
jgi:O-antigen/teichoic acid export membrane protein